MNIAILDATGLTGDLVLKQTLGQGHEGVARVRDPAGIALKL